jgi:hypothetical protein
VRPAAKAPTKDIPRLAEWYLEDYLGLNPLSKHLSISSGLETALRYRNSEAVSLDNLHALLGENMVPGSSDKAIQMFDVILKNCMANVTPVFPGAMTPNQDGSPSPSPEVQEAVKKKRKQSGGQELEGRLQIGQAKTIKKKAELCVSLFGANKRVPPSSFNPPLQKILYGRIRPVTMCVEYCHGGSCSLFATQVTT